MGPPRRSPSVAETNARIVLPGAAFVGAIRNRCGVFDKGGRAEGARRLHRSGMEKHSIRKIAVAIDFVDEADDILRVAEELGKGLSAELHLVHIYQPDPDPFSDAIIYPVLAAAETEAEHEQVLQGERRQLRAQTERLKLAGAKAFGEMKPVEKSLAESILEFADDLGVDMIIIGTRRPGRIEELLVGSVAKTVLKKSRIPVLLVPRAEIAKGGIGS